jgi:RNA polymerase subunit RPABC4/transcription elongation factor Spt4
VESTVTNWLEVIVILHTLLDMARKRELKKKFKIKKLDVFNKGGNCKLQEGV